LLLLKLAQFPARAKGELSCHFVRQPEFTFGGLPQEENLQGTKPKTVGHHSPDRTQIRKQSLVREATLPVLASVVVFKSRAPAALDI